MIHLNIYYPNSSGSHFNVDYYLGTHMPTAQRLFVSVLKEVTLEKGVAGVEPDSPPSYIMSCHKRFDSIEVFMEAW